MQLVFSGTDDGKAVNRERRRRKNEQNASGDDQFK